MKKLLTLLLAVGFSLAFVACGGNTAKEEATDATEAVEETAEEAVEDMEDATEEVMEEADSVASDMEEAVEDATEEESAE